MLRRMISAGACSKRETLRILDEAKLLSDLMGGRMARRDMALRKVLGFAPAITAGLALAAAVELMAGSAWKPARPSVTAISSPPKLPAPPAAPAGKALPPAILAPASVYDWSSGKET
jgi:hypothetical protein